MIRLIQLIVFLACLCLPENTAVSQTSSQLSRDQLRGTLDIQNAKIGEQRVQRQTEISRLEELLRTTEDRLTRLERRVSATSQAPLITIAEAEAEVAFTLAQLQESERLHTEGKITDVALARHRLDHVQAEAQLDTSKFTHADRLIALEMEVLYFERTLDEQMRQQRHLERLVAKGYSSSDSLKNAAYDVAIAGKQVKQARLRLAIQRRATGKLNLETLLDVSPANSRTLQSEPVTDATVPEPPKTNSQ